MLTDIEHLEDVGMVEPRRRQRFLLEAALAVGVSGQGRGSTLIATSRPSRVSRAR
jgi:hypothetical protein